MSSTLPIKEIKEKVAKKPFYIDLNSKIEYDLANTDIYRKEIETDIIYFSLREQLFTSFIRAFNKTKAKGTILILHTSLKDLSDISILHILLKFLKKRKS